MGSAASSAPRRLCEIGEEASDPAYFFDAVCEFFGPIQKVEGGEVIGTAVVVVATLARADHEPGIVTGCRLARLNVHVIGCIVTSPQTAMPARLERRS
jgi:hypothetical protein